MDECVYRGEKKDGGERFDCRLFGECQLTGTSSDVPVCKRCKQSLNLDHPKFPEEFQDPLVVLDHHKQKTISLRNMLAGGAAFLVCGGPSANDQPTELLMRRGIWSLGVNNVAGHLQCNAMVCSDPPSKFSHSIWLDPRIMKFVPTPKMRGGRAKLRKKVNGEFSELGKKTFQCPNVWGFQRWSWLTPDDQFFLSDGACWGNHLKGAEKTGQVRVVCTMFLGLRLLYYLGARIIYLVGADFHMRPDYGYSFAQDRDEGASVSNNHHFEIVNDWMCQMQSNGVFDRFGLQVFNTFAYSGLRAFEFVPFKEAVEQAVGLVEENPDLVGWYEK